ncbi:MAG TPA: hypothetical protein VK784_01430 [Pseudonocardiaceae bacterium]|nr:hypothetical protein [Pseudonocardiaceae bacterium]
MIRGNSPTAVPQPAPPKQEGEGDHVDISPERDTPPRSPAGGSGPGSAASWRSAARSPVTLQVPADLLLVCLGILFGLGLLLGTTWTIQALQVRLRHQAEERRRLNAEWAAIRTARQQRVQCPRCGTPLSGWD